MRFGASTLASTINSLRRFLAARCYDTPMSIPVLALAVLLSLAPTVHGSEPVSFDDDRASVPAVLRDAKAAAAVVPDVPGRAAAPRPQAPRSAAAPNFSHDATPAEIKQAVENNALAVRGTVFMPAYNVPADQDARKVYESLGYQVFPIPTVSLSDDMHGSIHCQAMAYPPMPERELLQGLGLARLY